MGWGNRDLPGRSVRLAASPGETRWRRSQRRRRRRTLTRRGRATLFTLASVGLGLAFGTALSTDELGWEWRADAGPESHTVAAAPPPALPPGAPPGEEAPAAAVPASAEDTAPDGVLLRLPVTRAALELADTSSLEPDPSDAGYVPGLLYETLDGVGAEQKSARVEYTLHAELTRRVFRILRRARVALGHVLVLDPASGRILAYASTDVGSFPPTRAYPAASLVKVVTAAAAIDLDPLKAHLPCRFRGSPYRLTPSRLDPPKQGREVSLRRALATSNNQCFAQLAVHAVGQGPLVGAIERFGWLAPPAPAHAAGSVDPGEDRFGLGKLGCGLDGCRITPLHAAQLAASLAHGELVSPRWIHRVIDDQGRELRLPAPPPARQAMSPKLAVELRSMLVDTTTSGTARSAFRRKNGKPLLGAIRVAGKTGSLSGEDPTGRYEWFAGVAPADRPRIAVAVLLVQGDLYWRNASQIAADVLHSVFCEKRVCKREGADRWLRPRVPATESTEPTQPTEARRRPQAGGALRG